MEIWRDIPNWEGKYQASNLGRIKSLQRRCKIKPRGVTEATRLVKEKILSPSISKHGYKIVVFTDGKLRKATAVHSLVAQAFLGHKPNGSQKIVVDHIDFNKLNNRLNNLRLISNRENTNQKHLESTSKYTGVWWAKDRNRWRVSIKINGKLERLGHFTDEYEAHLAYQKRLKEHLREDLK